MAVQVIWSGVAAGDLDDIRAYISRDSGRYAKNVIERILASGRLLERFPFAGRRVPELNDDRYRELIVYRYRVIYSVDGNLVTIITVIHGARLLPPDIGMR